MFKLMSKLFLALLAVAMVLGLMPLGAVQAEVITPPTGTWAEHAEAGFAGGDGSQGTPYQISNPAQLAYLAKVVNSGDASAGQSGKYFVLTGDIDLSAYPWEPIGYHSHCGGKNYIFKGNFDGNGHKITGLTFGGGYTSPNTYYSYAGLFGQTDGGSIKNLGVSTTSNGVSLDATNDASLGVLVGYAYNSTIVNCYSGGLAELGHENSFTFKSTEFGNVGGLIGYSDYCDINFCHSDTHVSINYGSNTGGLIGFLNRGTVRNSYSGGMVDARVWNVYAEGIGGFVGSNYAGRIYNSYTNSDSRVIYGSQSAGGTVKLGGFAGNNHGYIINCYSGSVPSIAVIDCFAGGFVGYNYGTSNTFPANIINSYYIFNKNGGFTQAYGGSTDSYAYSDIVFYPSVALANSASSVSYYTSFTDSATNTKDTAASLIDALNRGRAATGANDCYAWQWDNEYPVFTAPSASTITLKNKTAVYNGSAVTYGSSDIASQIGSYGAVSYTYYSDAACNNVISTPKNAGTYYVKATVQADSLYGGATSAAATLTINKATLTVTPNNGQQKFYCGFHPILQYTATGNVSGEVPAYSGAISRVDGEEVGTYPITQGTLDIKDNGSFLKSNYFLSFDTTKTFAIVPYIPTPDIVAVLDTPNGANGWFTNNTTIKLTAPSGFLISDYTVPFAGSITVNNANGTGKTVRYYLKRNSDNAVSVDLTSSPYKVDNSVPAGTITVGSKTWNSFSNTTNIGFFFKNSQSVTIAAANQVSGTTVQYLLSDTPIDSSAIAAQTGWQNGASLSITSNSKKYIYAKLTSGAGRTSYINSDGIVVYTDAAQNTASLTHVRMSADDETATVTLNGNTISKINDGAKDLVLNTDYSISGNVITFKAAYLNSLAAGSHTMTISYNPLGESYVAAAGNQAPSATTLAINIVKNLQPDITAGGIPANVTYGDAPFTVSAIGGSGTGPYVWSITNERNNEGNPAAAGSTATIDSNGLVSVKGAGSFTISVYRAADENYNQSSASTSDVTVEKKQITISGIKANNKTYDGTTAATLDYNSASFSDILSGDELTITATGTFEDESAGTGKMVNITSLQLGGPSVGNYQLATDGQQTTAAADITAKAVTVSGITANNKTYDATTTATLDYSNAVFTGKLSGDELTVTAAGTFNDKDKATGKTVNITSLQLGGANVGNYQLAADGQQSTATADITAKAVTVSGITANNKTYDGTTAATLDCSNATISGVLSGDTFIVTGATGTFADKNAETGKTVNITSLLLGGSSVGNYQLAADGQQSTATADIIAKPVIVSGITANNKIYDGTAAAMLDYSNATFSGVLSGDTLTVTAATGTFTDKNAGTGKTVNITSLQLGGANVSNYQLAADGQQSTATADITAKPVTVSGITASSKTYDDTTSVTLDYSSAVFTGKLSGDTLTVTATGTFADKNAGTGKTVNITSLQLEGSSVGNYQLTADGQQSTATADITPKAVTVSGITASNKTYDGTTAATLDFSNAVFSGKLSGDTLTVAATGTFADKNAVAGKTVNISSLLLGGPSVGNYQLAADGQQSTAIADITAKAVVVSGITANKTYDGTTAATFDYSNAVFTGMLSGDTLTITATGAFDDKNTGTGKIVNITSLQLGGSSIGNYQLAEDGQQTTATATITPAVLTVTPDKKFMLQGQTPPAYTVSVIGFVGGETEASANGYIAPVSACSTTNLSAAGTYTITSSSGSAINYTFNYLAGTLTVEPSYKVTFDSQGGSVVEPIIVATTGAAVTAPAAPAKAKDTAYSYTFAGWYKDSGLTQAWNFSTDTVTANINLYAKWTAAAISNGSTGGSTGTVPPPIHDNTSPTTSEGTSSGSSNEGQTDEDGGSSDTAQPSTEDTPQTTITVTGSSGVTASTTVEANSDAAGKASAKVTEEQVLDAVSTALETAEKQGKETKAKIEIKVNAPADAKIVEISIPKMAVKAVGDSSVAEFTVSTPITSVTFDGKSLDTISRQVVGDIKLTITKVDTAGLSEEAKQKVGGRPVYNFSMMSRDKVISKFGGNVTVSIPYTPKKGEDTNAIVIYYINEKGKLEMVSNCVLDPITGTIRFTVNHFSYYAVGYNKVSFKDVKEGAWYSKPVSFVAARGITTGTGKGNFSPEGKLTRGQCLVMAMRAFGIKPDENLKDNFADAGNTYYTSYLAMAKKMGITAGMNGNKFAPEREITRQEMFAMIYEIMKYTGNLPADKTDKTLNSFKDAKSIAAWAKDAMQLFVESGIVAGNKGMLSPDAKTTRAQFAQVLYVIFHK